MHRLRRTATPLLIAIVAAGVITAPRTIEAQAATPAAPQGAVAAKPADVASPDAILAALYDVISGPAGQERDWNRFRSLFAPGARLIPTRVRPDGGADARVLTPDDYATAAGPGLTRNGFFEREIHRSTESYGNVMHVFSTRSR